MIFWILYIVLGVVHVVLEFLGQSVAAFPAKALLMPVLMLAFRKSLPGPLHAISTGVLIALLFSWFGDLLLSKGRCLLSSSRDWWLFSLRILPT